MSYDNYFRRLNFDELDNFKKKKVLALTSDISSRFDPKIESLQSTVNSLTSQKSHANKVANDFFHFLMKRNITELDTRNIPQTKILKELKAQVTPPIMAVVWKALHAL